VIIKNSILINGMWFWIDVNECCT